MHIYMYVCIYRKIGVVCILLKREHSDEFEIHGGFEQKRQYFVRNNLHRQGEKQIDAHKLTNS